MNLKTLILSSLLILFITGCGKNDAESITPTQIEKEPEATIPVINNLSKEYLFTGDELIIIGDNFNQTDFQTKVFVNDTVIEPSSLSSTEIKLILETEKTGPSQIAVEVDGKLSEVAYFYALKKGWNQLTLDGNVELKKAIVLDNDDDIYVLGDLLSGASSWSNRLFKISPSAESFISTQVANVMNGSISNFGYNCVGFVH